MLHNSTPVPFFLKEVLSGDTESKVDERNSNIFSTTLLFSDDMTY